MSFENDIDITKTSYWSADQMFPARSPYVDPNGDLMVAIYSRERLCQRLLEQLEQNPDEETKKRLTLQQTMILHKSDTYVQTDDYFYDVVDDVNIIARGEQSTPETTLVVGQRIMTWKEFQMLTSRGVAQFGTFQEFREHFRDVR